MKLAAAEALAEIARMPIPENIKATLVAAYPEEAANGMFEGNGLKRDFVIPKPFDPRVVPHVARKVAEAAIKTGVAKIKIADFDLYEQKLAERLAKKASK